MWWHLEQVMLPLLDHARCTGLLRIDRRQLTGDDRDSLLGLFTIGLLAMQSIAGTTGTEELLLGSMANMGVPAPHLQRKLGALVEHAWRRVLEDEHESITPEPGSEATLDPALAEQVKSIFTK